MKKRMMMFAIALLLCGGAAAQAGFYTEDIVGDTQTQAEMLHTLGLFRGTENGYELDRAMTRAEAAVMLARFLGVEQEVNAGSWKSPFTDVPGWAGRYVGWLYQKGLAKGVSAKIYGADEPVTCEQFGLFLTRALSEQPDDGAVYDQVLYSIAQNGEIENSDARGFTRGDAVTLSVRALLSAYARQGDEQSAANYLIQKGVFSAKQLEDASKGVLRVRYQQNVQSGYIQRCIAGVVYAQSADGLYLVERGFVSGVQSGAQDAATEIYAGRLGSNAALYVLDPQTLEIRSMVGTMEGNITGLLWLNRAGACDFFAAFGEQGGKIYCRTGDGIWTDSGVGFSGELQLLRDYFVSGDGPLLHTDKTDYLLDEKGLVKQVEAPENAVPAALLERYAVYRRINQADTEIICVDTVSGSITDTYRVPFTNLDDIETSRAKEEALALTGCDETRVWGADGLYALQNGRLRQITDQPVADVLADKSSGVCYLLSAAPENRYHYYAFAFHQYGGDQILRLDSDGAITTLLSGDPAHGIWISKLLLLQDGGLWFGGIEMMGHSDIWRTPYFLNRDGKIETLPAPDAVRAQGWLYLGAAACKSIQADLDSKGVGAGAKPSTAPETMPDKLETVYQAGNSYVGDILQSVQADRTVLIYRDPQSGKMIDGYTVYFSQGQVPGGVQVNSGSGAMEIVAWGEPGLYAVIDNRLRQYTTRPAVDYARDEDTRSYVIISRAPGSGRYPAGDEIVRLCDDNTEQLLLPAGRHGLEILKVPSARDGAVTFEGRPAGQTVTYTYLLAAGEVTVQSAVNWQADYQSEARAVQAEQTRLKNSGV